MKRVLFSLLSLVTAASMAAFTAEANNNGTIQAAGPRGDGSGKNFFNIKGVGNAAQFRSWGVAIFHSTDFGVGFTVTDVTNFKVILVEANAAFTMPGNINFWLTTDVSSSIDPGLSPFVWQDNVTPDGVGNQVPLISLGQGSFLTTGNMNTGQVDTFSFSLSNDAKNYIANALNNGTDIRLVITPDSTDQNLLSVAATFAGFSINNLVGPTFEFDATGGGAMTGQIEGSAVGFQVVAFP